jgi:hypothetical protein
VAQLGDALTDVSHILVGVLPACHMAKVAIRAGRE